MEDQDVINRLPLGWRDMFNLFCKQNISDVADLWYMEAMQSSYGHRPDWHALLVSLQIQDPTIIHNKLSFKPRFLHLSEALQEMFLAFLVKESYIIPEKDLIRFVRALHEFQDVERRVQISGKKAHLLQQIVVYDEKVKDAKNADEECVKEAQLKIERPDDNESERIDDVIVIEEDAETGPPTKRQKLDVLESSDLLNENEEIVQMDVDKTEETDEIVNSDNADKIHALIEKLKEIWQGEEESGFPPTLSEVTKLSLLEVEWFCKRIDCPTMTDDSTELVCRHLCHLAESLSYASAVCILRYVVLHKVLHLTQTPSRKLSGAINLVAEKFPKQLVDSVVVPCVFQDEISSFQGDLICRLVKEKFSVNSRTYLVQKLVSKDFTLSESKLLILQALVENESDIDYNVISCVLDSLSCVSEQFAKNLKFGKMLLALVNKHGQKLAGENNMKFSSIVDKHCTFLKKAIKNALNKLK